MTEVPGAYISHFFTRVKYEENKQKDEIKNNLIRFLCHFPMSSRENNNIGI